MPDFDFRGLTRRQKELLTAGGWRIDMRTVQPQRATVQKLLDRGLVVERRVTDRRRHPAVLVSEYDVPLDVVQAWADHCAGRGQAGKIRIGPGDC